MAPTTTGLVRLTIDAPGRRMDLALPERSSVAELLPELLRQAGETLADDGVYDGGWMLRRPDGSVIDDARTLAAQRVHDGTVLHLVPRRADWPELEYDDLADTIASGASRTGRMWAARHTRHAGLAVGAGTLGLALVAIARSGPPWTLSGWVAVAVAVVLMATGTALSRAIGDAGAGAVAGTSALPFAFAGGAMVVGGQQPIFAWESPQLLAGCAVLLLASVMGLVGVVASAAVFVCGMAVGALGVTGAWIASLESVDGAGAAGVVAGAVLVLSPLLGPLSVRLGRVPTPVLPRTAADLVRDTPLPPRHQVYATVLRAESLLTGLLAGGAVSAACAAAVLATDGRTWSVVLLCLLCLGFCVRARLYPAIRQRLSLLTAGLSAAVALVVGPFMAGSGGLLPLVTPVLIAVAAVVVLAGLLASSRSINPYLSRYAELAEIVLVLACVPVVCAVLGVYGFVRGLGG